MDCSEWLFIVYDSRLERCIARVICWDRGRLARYASQQRSRSKYLPTISRFALITGDSPSVPANHLIGISIEVSRFCFSETSHYNFLATKNLNHNLLMSGPAALALKSDGKGARTWAYS